PSLFLHLIACATPAIDFLKNGEDPQRWYGAEVLAWGWLGGSIGQFGWFANPLLLLAYVLVLLREFMAASVFAVLALLFAAHSLVIFHQQFPGYEGEVSRLDAKGFGIGFYFWVASLLVAVIVPLVGSFVLKRRVLSDTITPVVSNHGR